MSSAFRRMCLAALSTAGYFFLVDGGIFTGWPAIERVLAAAPPYSAALWVAEDARETKYWPAYHYGLLLWLCWPIAIPHYILRTRGRRGLPRAVGVTALLLLPIVASLLGSYLWDHLPDYRS